MAGLDEIQLYSKRRTIYVIIGIVMLLFVGRLIQLQVLYQEWYGKKSEENSFRTIPRDPVRGYMYDRNGRLVVDNRPAFTVTIMPFEFDKKNINYLSTLLAYKQEFISERLGRGELHSRFVPAKIARDVDFGVLSALEERRGSLPGVDYITESKRHYTTRANASHILGYTKEISELQMKALGEEYVQGDVVGASGLEASYESVLRGVKGAEVSVVNVRGQVIGSLDGGKHDTSPIEGDDLLLTMDFELQALAESLFADKRGALVALDTRNGGVLAMLSKPDYPLEAFSGVTPPEIWRALNSDEAKPLFNRATLTRYPPGSTYKMILAVAALERKIVSPSWQVTCTGAYRFGNKTFGDEHVHGTVNMVEAIQKSCNVYFYQLMMKTGIDIWAEYGAKFGFGKYTGVDIGEETSGLLPTTQWMDKRYGPKGWTLGFLPSLGIGQGELGVSPMQMACYAAALAMQGTYYQPHAVKAIKRKGLLRVDTLRYETRQFDVSQNTWRVVREGMRRVVEEPGGTARLARVKGIQSAGKTGTSQNPHGKSHAWYIGFAPFDDPQIAIAVLIENVGYGGSYAAPIAGMCIEKYLFGRITRFDAPVVPFRPARTDSIPALTPITAIVPIDSLTHHREGN